MEIRIKINQKNNPYFAFMDFNDRLHPYYKHLLRAISSGNYTPKPVTHNTQVEQKVESTDKKGGEQQLEQQVDSVEEQQDEEDEDSDGDYELHPLLMGSRTLNTATAQYTTNFSNSVSSSAIGHNGSVSLSVRRRKQSFVFYFSVLFCPKNTACHIWQFSHCLELFLAYLVNTHVHKR